MTVMTMTIWVTGRLQEALQDQLGQWTGCLQDGGSREAAGVLLRQRQQVQLQVAGLALLLLRGAVVLLQQQMPVWPLTSLIWQAAMMLCCGSPDVLLLAAAGLCQQVGRVSAAAAAMQQQQGQQQQRLLSVCAALDSAHGRCLQQSHGCRDHLPAGQQLPAQAAAVARSSSRLHPLLLLQLQDYLLQLAASLKGQHLPPPPLLLLLFLAAVAAAGFRCCGEQQPGLHPPVGLAGGLGRMKQTAHA
jgi:hypothetical protein